MFNDEIGEFDYMDMPTPCPKCNSVFELDDEWGSEKWFPNTTICEDCYHEERREIMQDDLVERFVCNLDIPDERMDFYREEINNKLIELKNYFS